MNSCRTFGTFAVVCMAMAPATFSGTTLYLGRKQHPTLGRIEVLGYQNEAQNLAPSPNAMVLHIPARLTQDNFIPVGKDSNILATMVEAVRPRPDMGYGAAPGSAAAYGAAPVQVFDHDIYTILVAEDPTQIPAALHRVPEHKRPPLDPGLFQFYATAFPHHSLVLCCFDNTDARQAKPLMMWYPPAFEDWYVLPALDGHTGRAPDLNEQVGTDHWVIFGSDDAPYGWGTPVTFPWVDPWLGTFLPGRVAGQQFQGWARNGDFAITHNDLMARNLSAIQRLQPAPR
jgi:hypothetical protein